MIDEIYHQTLARLKHDVSHATKEDFNQVWRVIDTVLPYLAVIAIISFGSQVKIACPCHHHYAGNPAEGHILPYTKSLQSQPQSCSQHTPVSDAGNMLHTGNMVHCTSYNVR